MAKQPLSMIAYARSGDKGTNANIGVVALCAAGYDYLHEVLTADRVRVFFHSVAGREVVRYELPNLLAFNFVLQGVLGDGRRPSLQIDPQGKALGQQLLTMELDIPDAVLTERTEEVP